MADPWQEAGAAAAAAGVRLAPLRTVDDAAAISRVMAATWGGHQLLPTEMIIALAESGNVPWGAFDRGGMIGYVLGWAGVDGEGPHVHSHMLAVMPGRRSGGTGFALKLAQRAQALDQGFRVVRWTFDPLLAANAWFNLGKLGAVADRFGRDFYGEMEDSLNAGERSDRLVIRWDLTAVPREIPAGNILLERTADGSPKITDASISPGVRVRIPDDYQMLRDREPALASAWREASAEAFEACIGGGLEAVSFERDSTTYVFGERIDLTSGVEARR